MSHNIAGQLEMTVCCAKPPYFTSFMRIHEDNLHYEDDALVLNGKPFTGIGYADFPNGRLRREVMYVNGFPEGRCREWHENGQISKEWLAERGVAPSKTTEWYGNGQIKSLCLREHGVELEYQEWSQDGELVTKRTLIEGSPMHQVLLRMRKLKAEG
jgi:antitoxin component YwqK of YwqJK toxin-antitoxin module